MNNQENYLQVEDLTVAYGDYVLMKEISFNVKNHDIFFIMGGSGCGKSSLLHILTGLNRSSSGRFLINGVDFQQANLTEQSLIMQQSGILYQSGALFSSMTLAENVSLPLEQYTNYSKKLIQELVSLKLALVGLHGFEDFYPSEISGGMNKRAGLARALALDPAILYCDEPSAGLDPLSSKLLDDLIVELNASLGTTFVIVSHELASILSIGTNSIFLDGSSKSIKGYGRPQDLLQNPPNKQVYNFLTRGGEDHV